MSDERDFLPRCDLGCGKLETNVNMREYFLNVFFKAALMDGCRYLVFLLETDHADRQCISILQQVVTLSADKAAVLFTNRTAFCDVVHRAVVAHGGTRDILRSDNAVTRFVKNMLSVTKTNQEISTDIKDISIAAGASFDKNSSAQKKANEEGTSTSSSRGSSSSSKRKWSLPFLTKNDITNGQFDGDKNETTTTSAAALRTSIDWTSAEDDMHNNAVAAAILDKIHIPSRLSCLARELREKLLMLHDVHIQHSQSVSLTEHVQGDVVDCTVAHTLLLLRVICPLLTEMDAHQSKWMYVAKAIMAACQSGSPLYENFQRFVQRTMRDKRSSCNGSGGVKETTKKDKLVGKKKNGVGVGGDGDYLTLTCEEYVNSVLKQLCTALIHHTESAQKAGVKRQHTNIISLCCKMAISFESNRCSLHNPERFIIYEGSTGMTNAKVMKCRLAYERRLIEYDDLLDNTNASSGLQTPSAITIMTSPHEVDALMAALRIVSMFVPPACEKQSVLEILSMEAKCAAKKMMDGRSSDKHDDISPFDRIATIYKKHIVLRMFQIADCFRHSESFNRLVSGIACDLKGVFGSTVDVPSSTRNDAFVKYVQDSGAIGECVLREGNTSAFVRIFLHSVPAQHRLKIKKPAV